MFVCAGTEVFHRQCAVAGGIETSVSHRQKQVIAGLRAKVHQLTADAQEAARLRTQIGDLERDLRTAKEDAHRALQALRRESSARRDAENDLVIARERIASERRLAAILELPPIQVTGPVSTPAVAAPTEPQEPIRDLDDAEQRFRLLELDPLE